MTRDSWSAQPDKAQRSHMGSDFQLEDALVQSRPALLRVAARLCGDRQDANDLLQDALEQAVRRGVPGDVRDTQAWLITLLRRLFVDRSRLMQRLPAETPMPREPNLPQPSTDEPESAWSQITLDDVREALEAIEPPYREVYRRHAFEKQSYEEIAREMGIPRVAVGTRLVRARKRLREVLIKRFGMEAGSKADPRPSAGPAHQGDSQTIAASRRDITTPGRQDPEPPSGSGAAHGGAPPGGDGGQPPSGGDGDRPPPPSVPVTRYLDASCPSRVARSCDRFPLTVALLSRPSPSSAVDASLQARSDAPVDVVVSAPEFEMLGTAHTRISTEGDRAVFFLRPTRLGLGCVTLDLVQQGNPLGTFAISIEVVERDIPYDTSRQSPRELQLYDGAASPDYILTISYDRDQVLHFRLRSREDLDDGKRFAPVRLQSAPEEFMRRKYRDLDILQRGIDPVASTQLGTARTLSPDRVEERLQKLGYGLWNWLIPRDLKQYYAEHRDEWRDKTFVIMSDEPSIPWELVWPYDDTAARWEDSNPWCLTLRLSRWLRRDDQGNGSAGPPSSLLLTQLATLIPSDTGLPATRAESEYLRAFVQRHGVRVSGIIPATKENAERTLSTGGYDWLHVAAHGAVRDAAQDTTSVWLENGEPLTPDDIVGPRIERHIRTQRPAFVLNACTAARSGWELTGISGWANQLIKIGAGLVLAPLWSVTDDVAKEFVTAFYDALENNACVADAMRAARMTARRIKGDPTWMAYVLFAHPNARVALGAATGP